MTASSLPEAPVAPLAMHRRAARRSFLRWVAGSSLAAPLLVACRGPRARSGGPATAGPATPEEALNLFDLERAARRSLPADAHAYLEGGADDARTLRANREAYARVAIRARRLVDVSSVDTSLELLGERLPVPVLLAPVGFQACFHPGGELAVGRAAAATGERQIVSSVSSYPVEEVARGAGVAPWFQLYPTNRREVTAALLARAEAAGCRVVVLTVDTPAIGNRERHGAYLARLLAGGDVRIGNFEGLPPFDTIEDPALTWDFCGWLKARTRMRLVLKGIVTYEDTLAAVQSGADAVIVSNHGGRQLESDRATLDCLPEVVAGAGGRIPVLLDGGVRRGTDVFKALALGARAVCIGRPHCWGLAAFGQAGVERVLGLLRAELVRDMQLAGTPRLTAITKESVTRALPASEG